VGKFIILINEFGLTITKLRNFVKIISALEFSVKNVYRGDCVGCLIGYLIKLYQLQGMRLHNLHCKELVQY
jgi:hypothetical protein